MFKELDRIMKENGEQDGGMGTVKEEEFKLKSEHTHTTSSESEQE